MRQGLERVGNAGSGTGAGPQERPSVRDLVLGLDVGGTKLAAGVVAPDGRVLSWLSGPTRVEEGPDAVIARHVDLGRDAVAEAGVEWSSIASIGIGCGGPLDPVAGIIQSPPNLPGWDDVPLVAIVEAALDRPTAVDNDATAGGPGAEPVGAGRAPGGPRPRDFSDPTRGG